MINLRFGDHLAQLLRERACSGLRLANMLNIDPALVYRWLRNEAVPKLDAAYCDEITLTLHLSQAEVSRLKEAQIFSLSNPLERRPKARSVGAAVEHLLRQAGPRSRSKAGSPSPLPSPNPPVPRPSGVIWGRPALLKVIISLLENLPPLSRLQSNTLLLTFQGAEDAFDDFPELHDQYLKALQEALQLGWQVCHLWRVNQDSRRSIVLVESILKLLGTGRYLPSYISDYGTLTPPYELLIIPRTAALLCFATQNPRRVDAGLLTHNLEQIELPHTHFYQLHAMSQPLAHIYLPQRGPQVWRAYADAESQPGGRVVVKDGLSFITEPHSWYSEDGLMAQTIDLSEQERTIALESQHCRYAAFQINIASYPYRDICPRRAIERLAQYGEAPSNDRLPPSFRLSQQARREQLERAIYLLRTYKQYELALIDEQEEQFIPTEMFWEVTGQHSVLMLSWSTDMRGKDIIIELAINEPSIVRAFHDYFAELWERIAPSHKDKAHVIEWLEHQVAQLSVSIP